jgi:hypothetical protein
MVPPSLDQPSKLVLLDFAEDAPQSGPGQNASRTSTFSGKNERPLSRPQRGSGADQGKHGIPDLTNLEGFIRANIKYFRNAYTPTVFFHENL